LVDSRAFILLSIALVAIRFATPTVSAGLAVADVDTTGLDASFEIYMGVLPGILFFLALLVVNTWPGGFGRDPWILLAVALSIAVTVQWAGQVNPSLRILTGSFVGAILDGTVAATILAFFLGLDRRVVRAGVAPMARDGFRALGYGYTLSYVLHAFRLIDFRYAFGQALPSGLLWLLDYGPTITLSFLSIYFWFELSVPSSRGGLRRVLVIAPPVVVATLGLAASQGLGGFLMSNALAWGGSYLVFSPTSASLSIVGFAIGAFLATAWALFGRLSRRPWRHVVGGTVVVAVAGILSFGGTLSSLAGIVLGLTIVARGLVEVAAGSIRASIDANVENVRTILLHRDEWTSPGRPMRGDRRRYGLALAVFLIIVLGILVPAPAAPITAMVPYSATPVADSALDGDPATGDWSGAQSWTVPLENGANAPYGSATLYAKHDATYVYFRVDGKIDVLWASVSGDHFWFGIAFSTGSTNHHSAWQDGVFFGDDSYTSGTPLLPVDTNGGGKPPAKDGTQNNLGEMRATGSSAPYSYTAEWKRKLNTGDSNDLTFTADSTTSYYFYATTDSDGGGSGGGNVNHKAGTTNNNIIRFETPPPSDPTPPTVSITAPADGAFLRQTVLITATASDNIGVTSVTFLLDATTLGMDTAQPYEYSWDTSTASNGAHVLKAEARDAAGNVGSSQVSVTVDNAPPVAAAGADRSVSPGTVITFDGSASTDNVGVASYTWTFNDGGPQTLTGISPTYTFNNVGNFLVTLTVSDAAGNTATDVMWVNVTVDTAPPVARAGADQPVLQGALVTLDGSGSTDDVGIANYTWTFDDGGAITLYDAIVQHRFLSVRNVLVTLTVKDFAAKSSTDTTWVNVSADTVPPTADAGAGQSIYFGASATLDGGGSTDNVGIANYTWSFADGSPIILWGSAVTYRFGSVANVTVTLTVLDYAQNSDTATTYVDVLADAVPPTARAGPDVTIDLGDSVLLNATASTDNVGIVSFSWEVQETGDTLTGEVVTYRPATGGLFTIVLTVTDAAGNTATDRLVVTVIAPDTTAPAAPTGLQATTAGPATVTLSWVANGETDLAGYLVFRLNADGQPVQLNAVPITNTSYVDSGLNPGETYTYLVKAVDRAGNLSGPSTQVSAPAGLRPPEPFDWMSVRWAIAPLVAAFVFLVLAVLAWRESDGSVGRGQNPESASPPPEVRP